MVADIQGFPPTSRYFNIVKEANNIKVITKITCVNKGLYFI